MRAHEHLVLCGGAEGPRRGNPSGLNLNLHGASGNVHLKIEDISRPLVANVPHVSADLLEVATYIYAADSASSRGGKTDAQMGARWRRNFRFVIPVRQPDLWSSNPVTSALVETISFLSDDNYEFEFRLLEKPPPVEGYFEFSGEETARFTPDEVILFSGGLDSFAGTVEVLVAHGKKVALVSHRSATKIASAQKHLVDQLRARVGADRVLHIPIWASLDENLGREFDPPDAIFSVRSLRNRDGALVWPRQDRLFREWRRKPEPTPGRPGRRRASDANHSPTGHGGLSSNIFGAAKETIRCHQSVHVADESGDRRANIGERVQ